MSLKAMLAEVAAHYELYPSQLLERDRRHVIAHPRQAFMWHARQVRREDGRHRYSTLKVAGFLGMNHTTVVHGVRKHQARLASCPQTSPESVDVAHVHGFQTPRSSRGVAA